MEFWILYYVCSDEHECAAEQKNIDHIEGIFVSREAAIKHAHSEWGADVPLFENKQCALATEFPCYFLHRYNKVDADGVIS